MGKTQKGAVWLDPRKTPPYEFFQYWRNVADDDVINCLKMLTFVPVEEIEAMERWQGSEINKAKEILAYELTKSVHGGEEAGKALKAAKAVFAGGGADENMPTTTLTGDDLTGGAINILELMVKTGLCASKGEARRLVEQNGLSIDLGDGSFRPVGDIAMQVTGEQLAGGTVIVKKGKKVFHKLTVQ